MGKEEEKEKKNAAAEDEAISLVRKSKSDNIYLQNLIQLVPNSKTRKFFDDCYSKLHKPKTKEIFSEQMQKGSRSDMVYVCCKIPLLSSEELRLAQYRQ